MGTIFVNFGNSKTTDHYRLLIDLSDKKTEKREINMLLYQVFAYTIHEIK